MAYIMIVDDDADFAAAASVVLEKAGHEVKVELDTAAAAAAMERRRPDLVVLDVMFPESPSAGFGLARVMSHQNEKLKGIPILMLTAINAKFPLGFGPRDIDDTWLPVSDFLEKPVDLDVLVERTNQLLAKSKQKTAREEKG